MSCRHIKPILLLILYKKLGAQINQVGVAGAFLHPPPNTHTPYRTHYTLRRHSQSVDTATNILSK